MRPNEIVTVIVLLSVIRFATNRPDLVLVSIGFLAVIWLVSFLIRRFNVVGYTMLASIVTGCVIGYLGLTAGCWS